MDINISQDIRKFKTKDIGPFSFKEAAFVAVAVGVGYGAFVLFNSLEAALPFALVVLVVGFLKPFGMSFTQFIRTVGKEQVSPKVYIWESDFVYDKEDIKKDYGDDVVFSEEWDVIQTVQTSEIYKPQKNEKSCFLR